MYNLNFFTAPGANPDPSWSSHVLRARIAASPDERHSSGGSGLSFHPTTSQVYGGDVESKPVAESQPRWPSVVLFQTGCTRAHFHVLNYLKKKDEKTPSKCHGEKRTGYIYIYIYI